MVLLALMTCMTALTTHAADAPRVTFDNQPNRLRILIDGEPLADFVPNDPHVTRPYFARIHAPGGVQVTRNQPPVAGVDLMDHPTFHPGLWLAFGDLSGADDWRLKAPVRHVAFVDQPASDAAGGRFSVRNSYRALNDDDPDNADEEICQELFRCQLRAVGTGRLICWDSTFTSDREFSFGDQEEMGLGLRVATPLRAQRTAEGGIAAGNGEIHDAEGRRNEKEVWGNAAAWCDYSGLVNQQRVGMTIFCHPDNFRPSWFHARDRGLLVANPFGRAAFHQGEPSKIVVKPGESLRLRYGILVHASPDDEPLDLAAAYREYVELTREN